ncbi:MAG: PD-(D/E)XK nuclease family protein, partial [Clostridia bacterium]|nr:PD-(D/E)XK nuclease family protein [Clostridia bacterium]
SPVKLTSGGILYKNSPFYTKRQYDILSKYLEFLLIKNANEIISGDISVNPVDGSVDACKYCDYSEICKFQGEHFKAERMESTQVFEKMLKAVENGGE